jgi:hypothetical protein
MPPRRLFLLLILSVAAGVIAFFLVPKPLPELSWNELIAEVHFGYVHQVVIVDDAVVTAVSTRRGPFRVVLRPGDQGLIDELPAMGVEVRFETTPLGLI